MKLRIGDLELRMGELARELNIPRSTVKFYTDLGLFKVKRKTKTGHYLFNAEDALRRYQIITELKKKRLTLKEIKKQINKGQGEKL